MSQIRKNKLDEIKRLLKQVAGKASPGEYVPDLISRAASRTGIPESRIFKYWYDQATIVHAEDMDAVREAAGSTAAADAVAAAYAMIAAGQDLIARLPRAALRALKSAMPSPRMVA